jgi:hypothetical protein
MARTQRATIEAANVVNEYYMEKMRKIRAGRGVQNSTPKVAVMPRERDTGGKNSFCCTKL